MQRHDGRQTERQEDRDRLAWRRRGNKNRKLEIKVEKNSADLWAKFLSLSPSLSLSHIHALSLSLSLYLYLTRSLSFFRPAVLARTVASPHFLGILLTAARVEEVVVV